MHFAESEYGNKSFEFQKLWEKIWFWCVYCIWPWRGLRPMEHNHQYFMSITHIVKCYRTFQLAIGKVRINPEIIWAYHRYRGDSLMCQRGRNLSYLVQWVTTSYSQRSAKIAKFCECSIWKGLVNVFFNAGLFYLHADMVRLPCWGLITQNVKKCLKMFTLQNEIKMPSVNFLFLFVFVFVFGNIKYEVLLMFSTTTFFKS